MSIYRTTVFGRFVSNEIFNWTWHTTGVTGMASAVAIAMGDAVTLMWQGPPTPGSSLQQLYDAGTNVDGVRSTELDSLGKGVAQAQVDLTLLGTGVDEPLPPQIAIVVSHRTAVPTRAGRGRIFLPAPMVSTITDQRLQATPRAQVLAAAKAALDHLNTAGFPVVVYHRNDNTSDPITSIDVGDVLDTQRRRRNQLAEVRVSAAIP